MSHPSSSLAVEVVISSTTITQLSIGSFVIRFGLESMVIALI
jgi:hypothetical protein